MRRLAQPAGACGGACGWALRKKEKGKFLSIQCILSFYLVLVVVVEKYDYVFPENGLVAYKDGKLLCKQVSF